jgi:ABC-type transport system involved in cytochrome c biogenesis permease subunit
MTWADFNYMGPISILGWMLAVLAIILKKKRLANLFMILGILVLAVFMVCFWLKLGRPPMRTMGETRLWYSFFLALAGFLGFKYWKYWWLLVFSALLATVFSVINLAKPEIHSAALMPALQSYYFIPHVIVYMLSYSLLAVATITSVIQLRKIKRSGPDLKLYLFLDNVVYVGLGFLMLGLISGSLWAKEAWGHYWSWDPKETWAFVTCAAYLLYIHLRPGNRYPKFALLTIVVAFIFLMITWLGVSYLPTATTSIHVYS